MSAARPDQLLLQSAGIADAALVLGVMGDAPAPSVDPVVALDQLRKGVPRWTRQAAGLVGSPLGRARPPDICADRLAIGGFSRA